MIAFGMPDVKIRHQFAFVPSLAQIACLIIPCIVGGGRDEGISIWTLSVKLTLTFKVRIYDNPIPPLAAAQTFSLPELTLPLDSPSPLGDILEPPSMCQFDSNHMTAIRTLYTIDWQICLPSAVMELQAVACKSLIF